MPRKVIVFLIVPTIVILGVIILYFTRSAADIYVNEFEVSRLEFSSPEPVQFGELERLNNIILFNSTIELSQVILVKSEGLSIPPGSYSRILFMTDSASTDDRFSLKINPEFKDEVEMNFQLGNANSLAQPLKKIIEVGTNPKSGSTDLEILSLSPSRDISATDIIYRGNISPIPGQKSGASQFTLISKSTRLLLVNARGDTARLVEPPAVELTLNFSRYTKIDFNSYWAPRGVRMQFFFSAGQTDNQEPMHILRNNQSGDGIVLRKPVFTSASTQEKKLTITYSGKEEFQPDLRTHEELFIESNHLQLTGDVKLISDHLEISLKGRSNNVLKEQTQLIDSNFDRFPKVLSAIIIIIAYVLDKVITIFNFINSPKNKKSGEAS